MTKGFPVAQESKVWFCWRWRVLSLLLLLYLHSACTLASMTKQNHLERVFSWVPNLICPISVNSLFCYAPEGSDSTKHAIRAINMNAPQTCAACKPAVVYLNQWEFCHWVLKGTSFQDTGYVQEPFLPVPWLLLICSTNRKLRVFTAEFHQHVTRHSRFQQNLLQNGSSAS